MKKQIYKKPLIKLLLTIISEFICFFIIKTNLIKYDQNGIYSYSINIVQGLYFLPILLLTIYIYLSKKTQKTLLINCTIFLIIYSIILHNFITPIASIFTATPGVINFVKYASKIYFICLPLVGFRILKMKLASIKQLCLLGLERLIGLALLTVLLGYWFGLTGVLYGWSLSEMGWFIYNIKN